MKQDSHLLHDLALHAAGTTTAYRLVAGRCLLAMDRTESYLEFGCSSSIHYARKMRCPCAGWPASWWIFPC